MSKQKHTKHPKTSGPAVGSTDLVSRVPCPQCLRLITLHNDSTFHWHGKVGKHCPMSGKNIWQDPTPEPGSGRTVLHGYMVPSFNWDHGSPSRLFLPTLTREPVNSSDRKCTVTIVWEANAEVSHGGDGK